MAKRRGFLEINRKKHNCVWWFCVGWWERPIAGVLWLLLAEIGGFKGVEYHYYE